MRNLFTGKKSWVWLVIFLLVFISISYFLISKQPQDYPNYVSDSPAPMGTKAIYTYLEQEYNIVDRWTHSPNLLIDNGSNQLLVMIEPIFIPDAKDMSEYIDFMENGNTIMLFQNNPHGMFDISTVPIATMQENTTKLNNNQGLEYEAFLPSYERLLTEEKDRVILSDMEGVVALERNYGDGTLIVANTPIWMTNEHILEEDHLEIIQTVFHHAGGEWGSILFDEYSHGTGNKPTVNTLYPQWILVLGFQLLLLTIFYIWNQGKRFGPIVTPREETVRFSNERIKALAAWYQRGKRYQDSLIIQADYLRIVMQEKWGISYRKDWEDITNNINQRSERDPKELKSFINGVSTVLTKPTITKQEYLLWSRKIDQLRKEVEDE
ncbi:DUF4350 domain-containing protein [Ornithinibacillus halophilus]|uniref:DUF4350 domain-containing protein n=1 Tax=Ornithinibacillus halophilus TaxID=930117 RepID=A0A1M5G8T1_9BACI|nr:DUF4350 domain-containing protein [Ornithinibacillus halophilus]SHG00126.1 protein of unknown function [Ornithinibacillus halophilus]